MKLDNKLVLAGLLSFCLQTSAQAQERASGSLYLRADSTAQVSIPFSLTGEGKRYEPLWGLDQAWISEQNMRKGINHMGKENVGIGRSCFRTNKELINDSVLNNAEISKLRERNRWLNLVSDTLPIILTADQEGGTSEYYVVNKNANVDHWAANINSHVDWLKKNAKHPVLGVSIFNEPDYWSVEEGATTAKQTQIARILREKYRTMDDVLFAGGNTLNDDKALEWYNASKQYLDWGNTHQLAGSFANFANFYKQVAADGKVGYADEMHNVGEAMIGLEYGMTVGIWWGFDSRARGEFCDISRHGERLAYGEHRNNWTAASVWRHDDGRVKAFIGSSERQAATTTYQFVSTDRDVYFDGFGPYRSFRMEIPGGTPGSYQKGQTNAERVIDVTWGENVAPTGIESGLYKLVNKGNGNVAAVLNGNIVTTKYTGTKAQQWKVSPTVSRIGGDYSFYDFRNNNDGKCMDVENFSCLNNANVIAWSPGTQPSSNQQWYLQYVGNGYYYLRNRESALYLSAASNKTTNGINICQRTLQADSTLHECQLWRLLPVDVDYETTPPTRPVGLVAEAQQASVKLSWTVSEEEDVRGYMVLRAEKETGEWNTIARNLTTPTYVDNTCRQGVAYIYKVKAIDQAQNYSECSETAEAQPTGEKGLMAHWLFNESLCDDTQNQFDAATHQPATYTNNSLNGLKALNLQSGNTYAQLPYELANNDEMTIAMWVNWRSSTTNNQHIFDFGNSADECLYLTPSNNDKVMSLVVRHDGNTVELNSKSRLSVLVWKHVAVTIGRDSTVVYVDGEKVAMTTGNTIRPSDIHPVLNYIGRSQSASDPMLKAYVADVHVYNQALAADEVMALKDAVTTSINDVQDDTDASSASRYTLDGRKTAAPQRGIVVEKNRKYVVK